MAPKAPTMTARVMAIATHSRTARRAQLATTSPSVGASIGRCLVTPNVRVSNSSSRISINSMAAKPAFARPCWVSAA